MKIKYEIPHKDGIEYWVPIVIKNRDRLVGYMEGINKVLKECESYGIRISLEIDSMRFCDVIDHKGTRAYSLTTEELKQILEEKQKSAEEKLKQEEETGKILKPTYLEIHCMCGNYYRFHNDREIPEENLICGLCDRLLIWYIHKEDYEIIPTYER